MAIHDADRNIELVARGYGFGELAELSFALARDNEPVLDGELMAL